MQRFANRMEAGLLLAHDVAELQLADPIVLALPRGGVPVAAEVARQLQAPLDLLMVRKIGAPFQRELAVAAVVDGAHHEVVVDHETAAWAGVDQAYIDAEARRQLQEIERRRAIYLRGRTPLPIAGKLSRTMGELTLAVRLLPLLAVGPALALGPLMIVGATPAFFLLELPLARWTHQLGLRDEPY